MTNFQNDFVALLQARDRALTQTCPTRRQEAIAELDSLANTLRARAKNPEIASLISEIRRRRLRPIEA